MPTPTYPPFRPGTELATAFTGTLTERRGKSVERLPVPSRLADWFTANGLDVSSCTETDLHRARELREAIHACATAAALGEPLPSAERHILNEAGERGTAAPVLTRESTLDWRLGTTDPVGDALGVIALDAITIISGERDGRLALCASTTCRAAFFDTSRSRTRRWCDMNTCGNRAKKTRFQTSKRPEH